MAEETKPSEGAEPSPIETPTANDPKPGTDPTKGEPPVLDEPVPADPVEAQKEVKPDTDQDPAEPPPPLPPGDQTVDPSPKPPVERPPVPRDPVTRKPQISIDYVRTLDHCNPIYGPGGPFDGWVGDVDKVVEVTDIPIFDRLWVTCRPEVLGKKAMRDLGAWAIRDLLRAANDKDPIVAQAIPLFERAVLIHASGLEEKLQGELKNLEARFLAIRPAFEQAHQNLTGQTDFAPTEQEILDWGALQAMGQVFQDGDRQAAMDPVLTAEDAFQKAQGDQGRADFETRFIEAFKRLRYE